MPTTTRFEIPLGSTDTISGTIRDRNGDEEDWSNGGDPPGLALVVWPGDDREALDLPGASVAWTNAALGAWTATIDGADTAGSVAGEYRLQLAIGSGPNPTIRDVGILRLTAVPGVAVAPLAYGTADGVRRIAGGWLDQITGGTSAQSNFAEELGDARSWTDRQVLARAESALSRYGLGDRGDLAGGVLWSATQAAEDGLASYSYPAAIDARTASVAASLAADGLILSGATGEAIRRANEHYAASIILGRAMASKDDRSSLMAKAAMHRNEAIRLLNSATYRIDSDDDGEWNFSLPPGA